MVLIELIGSISLAVILISAVAFTIIYVKNKQNKVTCIDNHESNTIKPSKHNSISSVLPFERFNEIFPINSLSKRKISTINMIDSKDLSTCSILNETEWTLSSNESIQPKIIHSSSNVIQTSGFEQGDTLSLTDETINVRDLIDKFENNSTQRVHRIKNNSQTNTDLATIDKQIVLNDFNQNQQKISYDSSISNLNVTIPSNLSISTDLEQLECVSTSSNISDILNQQ